MAVCSKCGVQVEDEVKFCPSCGTEIGTNAQSQGAPAPAASAQANSGDAEENKVMAILAYILFFIPLIAGTYKTSPFVRFHTNQGILLVIASIASSILGAILNMIPVIGPIISVLINLAIFVMCILGIVNAAKGKMQPLPVIGNMFTILK